MSPGSSETPAEPDLLVPLVRRLLEAQAALADRLALQAPGIAGHQETQVPAAHGSLETLVSAFDGLGCQVAALDASARVRAVNAGWLSFGADNGRCDGGMDIGTNYLAVCESARGVDAFYAAAAASSLREVLNGHKDFATVEYACDAPAQPRWFRMMVLTVPVDGRRGALVVHAYQPALTSAEPLQRALRLLANAQQVAHIGCWEYDFIADRLHWNDATCALFGVDPQHFGGRLADLLARVEPAERPRLADSYRQFSTQTDGTARELEYRIRRDDGQQRVVHERAEEVRDANGRPLGRLGVVMDVTEQCQDREAALVQGARFRRLFARSPIPIWVHELDSLRFLAVNPAAVRQYGYSEQEFLGMTLLHVMPPEEAARLGSHLHELQSGGDGPPQTTWLQQRRDGDVFTAEVYAESLEFEGQPARLVVALDITERLRAQQAREQQVLAEAASRTKSVLLSHVSHELRTPLNAVLGFAQLLLSDDREPLRPAQARKVETIVASGWHLLSLIDDLLNVALIESAGLELELQHVDAVAACNETMRQLQPQAQRAGISMSIAPAGAAAMYVVADPKRLHQVLLKLMSNAVKYNRPGGSVEIRLSSNGPMACIALHDTGAGMSSEQLRRLFVPLDRLGRERGAIPGIGLGMFISQKLTELMHGEISVSSVPAQGTCVRVSLPLGS